MSGFLTYVIIRNMLAEQKVIIASGYSETGDLDAAIEAGVNGFIKKPYSLAEMGKALRDVLGRKSVQ